MISVIVCSVLEEVFRNFSNNVSSTIGVDFEIIRIDNSGNEHGICSAYNEGIKLTKFPLLCFVHEDVIFETPNWGKHLISAFEDNPGLGLLGIAGSRYKSFAPASWGLIPAARFVNINQQYKHRNEPQIHDLQNPSNDNPAEVICVDGVFMCTTKKIAEEIGFDSATLKGFHGYDIDFSLAVKQKYKVAVTFDILLTHFSEGRNDADWVKEMMKLHKKWKQLLPLCNMSISHPETQKYEGYAVHDFTNMMMLFKFPAKDIFKMLNYNNSNPNLNKNFLVSLKLRAFKYWLKNILPGNRHSNR